jgi:hypothetical protein
VKQLNYAMQFKGSAAPDDPSEPAVLSVHATAQSSVIRSAVGLNGLSTAMEGAAGASAKFDSRVRMGAEGAFDEDGTISFGEGNCVRFATVNQGYVAPTNEPGITAGAVIWRVEGGEGQFAGASGLITSNFYFNVDGEVTDNQFGVIFVP